MRTAADLKVDWNNTRRDGSVKGAHKMKSRNNTRRKGIKGRVSFERIREVISSAVVREKNLSVGGC